MTKISWVKNTDGSQGQTWNPIIGCSKVSSGCANCYAETMAFRQKYMRPESEYNQVTTRRRWNGKTVFVESQLDKPLKRKKPTNYFVCSMGDLFHESVPFEWIDKVFAVIALCPQHTFQVLTKRPERMAEYFNSNRYSARRVFDIVGDYGLGSFGVFDCDMAWPLDNVWLGTTTENQEQANKRIPHLLKCPAAIRFLSVEPMLGPVDLGLDGLWCEHCSKCDTHGTTDYETNDYYCPHCDGTMKDDELVGIDWVICGGESGHNARPMHPDWVRSLRDQCEEAGVLFFFKQWGGLAPIQGCRLDGKEHKQIPEVK